MLGMEILACPSRCTLTSYQSHAQANLGGRWRTKHCMLVNHNHIILFFSFRFSLFSRGGGGGGGGTFASYCSNILDYFWGKTNHIKMLSGQGTSWFAPTSIFSCGIGGHHRKNYTPLNVKGGEKNTTCSWSPIMLVSLPYHSTGNHKISKLCKVHLNVFANNIIFSHIWDVFDWFKIEG